MDVTLRILTIGQVDGGCTKGLNKWNRVREKILYNNQENENILI